MRRLASLAAALIVLLAADRTARSSGSVVATFSGEGPAPIEFDGDASGIAPTAGAVRGIVAHPTYRNWQGTLMNGLLWHARTWADAERPSLVGRLDKLTSGLVLVAKSAKPLPSSD